MLSIENQSDPLCSYKISGLKSDDQRASDDTLALDEVDLLKSGLTDDKHLPTFSIRDYALTSRRKGIERNWPFPQQYLELCLKHGIRDILPPFEPPDLVRKRSSENSTVESGELVCVNGIKRIVDVDSLEQEKVVLNCVINRSCLPIEQSDLDLSDQAQLSVQVQEKLTVGLASVNFCSLSRSLGFEESGKEVISTLHSSDQSERRRISLNRPSCSADVGTSSSKALIEEVEVSGAPSAIQKIRNTAESPSKKCRLIEKLGNLSDPSCVEDIVTSTTTISEPMSSKVCPVCKTFLSTSNTTLNAHIDQCLAMESTSKWAMNSKLSKIKVKPRKKRLMVDIYATAPRCTLEELDRRNGTNWAADSSLPTADAGVCAQGKRQRLSQEFPEDASDDNAVYFDSNGKKLRILSKLDGASVPRVGEDFGPRKHANENRESNICFPGKARRLGLKEKPLKVKPQSRKLCSLQPDRPEIYEASESQKYGMDENCDKDESLSEILKARDQLNPGELRQWVCSKRTGLSKKLNGKDGRRGPGYSSIMSRDPLIESNQTNFSNSSRETGSTVKFRSPLQNSSPSPTSRRKERPSLGVWITDKGERSHKSPVCHLNRFNDGSTSTSVGSVLKFSNSSRNHAVSPRNKRVEVRSGLTDDSNDLRKMTANPYEIGHHFSPKGKKLSNLKKKLLLVGPSSPKSKSTENERCSFLRNPHMHRSIAETREQVRAVISDVDREYDQMSDSTKNHSDSSDISDSTDSSDSSDSSESLMRHDDRYDEVSMGRNDLLESGHGRETSRTLGRMEVQPRALESLKSGSEEVLVNGKDSLTEQYAERSVRVPIIRSSETLISELHKQDSPSNESIEEHERSLYRTEAQMGSSEQSFSDDQESGSAEEVGNGNRDEGNSFSETGYTECGAEPISIPGPPGSFLPSPGDISSEIIVENSSLASNRLPSSQDQYFLVDRDSSGSPVSASSTISHSQTTRSNSKYVESTSFAGARADLEKFVSGFSESNTKLNIEETERIHFDGESLKATAISTPEGSLKFSDDHPCHCSRKETIPWSSSLTYQDLPRQQSMTPAILPSVGNQMNYNHKIWPEVFTTSSGCPSSNINENVPMMDLSRSSVTSLGSPDTAPKFPGHDNYGSTSSSSQAYHHSQSTSNPILRLMGKNLMIVNNDEDASVELKVVPPVAPNDGRANTKYPTLQGFSIGNISTENHVSFYHMVPDAPVIFSHDPSNLSRVGNHNNIHFGDFIGALLPQNGSKDRSDLQTHQERPIDRSNPQFTYNVHRDAFAAPQYRQHYPCYAAEAAALNPSREVIVIDDSPENEANLSIKYSQGSIGKLPSPVGVLPSPTLDPNSRQVNPFYCYPSQNSYTPRNTPVGPYQMVYPRGTNTPAKQGDSLYAFMPKQR